VKNRVVTSTTPHFITASSGGHDWHNLGPHA